MPAYKACNLLSYERFCSYFYIGNKAASLKGIFLLSPLKCALVMLDCLSICINKSLIPSHIALSSISYRMAPPTSIGFNILQATKCFKNRTCIAKQLLSSGYLSIKFKPERGIFSWIWSRPVSQSKRSFTYP